MVTGQTTVLAADVPFPPGVEDFYLPSILPWGAENSYWFTKITLLVWVSVAAIIIFFLARLGLVTPQFLIRKFKYAVVLAFVIAAVVTPTPDVVTQAALAVPMILLYLIGVGVAYLFAKPTEARA